MCSTPRPKSAVKGKAGTSGSILSSMSPEARSKFAERANAAQERRYQKQLKLQSTSNYSLNDKRSKKVAEKNVKKVNNSFANWLLTASIKELFLVLLAGKKLRT